MGYNEHFSKAVYSHQVPGAALVEYMKRVIGRPETEKQKLLEQIAVEIETKYPYEPGKEPKEET